MIICLILCLVAIVFISMFLSGFVDMEQLNRKEMEDHVRFDKKQTLR